MDWQIVVLALGAGYLIGSLSFARIVARLVAPGSSVTVVETPTAEPGKTVSFEIASATTVGAKLGSRYGMLTAVLDILKVLIPALVFKTLYPGQPYFLICAIAGMVGHIWPIYYRFKGGRGMSAAYAGMLAVDWIGVLVCWLLGTVLGFALRDAFVAYLGGIWLFIPWIWFRTHNLGYLLFAIAVNVILMIALIPEIRTYIQYQQAGKAASFTEGMESTPMGRELFKVVRRLGLMR
jgi:glycerol-3-phosphate acyltransferase PlsY